MGAFPVLKFRHSTNSASLRLCVKEGPLGSVNSIVLFSRAEPETMGSVAHFMTFPILHHRGTETQRVMWDQRGHPLALFSRAERTANDELHASHIGHQRTEDEWPRADDGHQRTEDGGQRAAIKFHRRWEFAHESERISRMLQDKNSEKGFLPANLRESTRIFLMRTLGQRNFTARAGVSEIPPN